ncbi:MAG: hypothetical protein GF347_04645 [Candidatus Moranbacteria bacterium]|nr:hypothetical protein [Candidatus Moranbacteria bacterium]
MSKAKKNKKMKPPANLPVSNDVPDFSGDKDAEGARKEKNEQKTFSAFSDIYSNTDLKAESKLEKKVPPEAPKLSAPLKVEEIIYGKKGDEEKSEKKEREKQSRQEPPEEANRNNNIEANGQQLDEALEQGTPRKKTISDFKLKVLFAAIVVIFILLIFGYASFFRKQNEKKDSDQTEESSWGFSFKNFLKTADKQPVDREGEVEAEEEDVFEVEEEVEKPVENFDLDNQIDLELDKIALDIENLNDLKQELYQFSTFNVREGEAVQLIIRLNGQDIGFNELVRGLNLAVPLSRESYEKFALALTRENGFMKFGLLIRTNNTLNQNRELFQEWENYLKQSFDALYFNEPLNDPNVNEGAGFQDSLKFVNGRYINLSKAKSYYLNYSLNGSLIIIGTSTKLVIDLNKY